MKALAKVCAADSSEEVLHVVRYHQAWIEDHRLFMQTELCDESLEQAMREGRPGGRMGLEEVFDFGRQMLLALDVLHRHGLVHLDVKVGWEESRGGVGGRPGGREGGREGGRAEVEYEFLLC